MTIKKTSFVLTLITMMCWQAPAWANYTCVGKVTQLGSQANGSLYIRNGYGTHLVCNLKDDGCKYWSSLATTAKVTERLLRIYYEHPSKGGENNSYCSSIGDWVTPADRVYFIELH